MILYFFYQIEPDKYIQLSLISGKAQDYVYFICKFIISIILISNKNCDYLKTFQATKKASLVNNNPLLSNKLDITRCNQNFTILFTLMHTFWLISNNTNEFQLYTLILIFNSNKWILRSICSYLVYPRFLWNKLAFAELILYCNNTSCRRTKLLA